MQWKPEHETGIAEIDGQHQTIIRLVTDFEAAVNAKVHWNELHPMVSRAKEYAKFHFAVEESLMQIFQYPRLSAHRSEHRFVLERVADLEEVVLRKDAMHELVPRLRTWMLGHFLQSDGHFVEFIRKVAPRSATAPVNEEPAPTDPDALEQAMRRAVGLE